MEQAEKVSPLKQALKASMTDKYGGKVKSRNVTLKELFNFQIEPDVKPETDTKSSIEPMVS